MLSEDSFAIGSSNHTRQTAPIELLVHAAGPIMLDRWQSVAVLAQAVLARAQGSCLDSLATYCVVTTKNRNMESNRAMLYVFIFLQMAAHADAIAVEPKHNARTSA